MCTATHCDAIDLEHYEHATDSDAKRSRQHAEHLLHAKATERRGSGVGSSRVAGSSIPPKSRWTAERLGDREANRGSLRAGDGGRRGSRGEAVESNR